MSTTTAEVETAYSFLEVLRQAEAERDELDEGCYMEDHPVSEPIQRAWDTASRTLLLANAIWVRRLVSAELNTTIQGYINETPLHLQRNPFSGAATLVTPGVSNGLRERVTESERNSEEQSEGRFSTVGPIVFLEMLREGVLDWSLRTATEEGYEVRCCAQCGRWFEPSLKGRSRFCSDKCRKTFNNLRNSDSDRASFECKGCAQSRPMEEFAGLRFEDNERKTATPLRMGSYGYGNPDNLCCVSCVRDKYPEWRRYIAPMETLSERASV